MTDKEYQALLTLYHEYNEAFHYLPDYIKERFFAQLYGIVE